MVRPLETGNMAVLFWKVDPHLVVSKGTYTLFIIVFLRAFELEAMTDLGYLKSCEAKPTGTVYAEQRLK
jgi:hypothetical protein